MSADIGKCPLEGNIGPHREALVYTACSTGSQTWPCIQYTWEALETLMTPPEILVLCSQGFVLGISWFISSPSDSNVQSIKAENHRPKISCH